MHRLYMSIKMFISAKTLLTNAALMLFEIFMNTINVFLRSAGVNAEYLHTSHLKGFLFSWTLLMWVWRVEFLPKYFLQMLHWCCLIFSWTALMFDVLTCVLIAFFWPKFFWRILNWCFLRFWWAHSVCLLKCECLKQNTHPIHIRGASLHEPIPCAFLVYFSYQSSFDKYYIGVVWDFHEQFQCAF